MQLKSFDEVRTLDLTENKNWYAWIDLMPPPPNNLSLVGEIMVANPGVKAILTPRVPQGINPTILMLELILVQRTGFWPQMMTWVEARYDKVVADNPYKFIIVYSNETAIVEVPVDEIH